MIQVGVVGHPGYAGLPRLLQRLRELAGLEAGALHGPGPVADVESLLRSSG